MIEINIFNIYKDNEVLITISVWYSSQIRTKNAVEYQGRRFMISEGFMVREQGTPIHDNTVETHWYINTKKEVYTALQHIVWLERSLNRRHWTPNEIETNETIQKKIQS